MEGTTGKKTEAEVFISEADQYLFAQGTHYDIYKKLGAQWRGRDVFRRMGAQCCKRTCDWYL